MRLRQDHRGGCVEKSEKAERPGARQGQVDDQPDHDRRQAHQRVHQDGERGGAGKSGDRQQPPIGMPMMQASAVAVRLT